LITNQPIASDRFFQEATVTERFLETQSEDSFTALYNIFRPQLVAFFRVRNCEQALAEDIAQEVMLIVYRKASQIRDRSLFRAWLFKIARNALCRHYCKKTREVNTVDLADVSDLCVASHKPAGTPAFEFLNWMELLDSRESEVMRLRFIEQWEYHEIAAAHSIPIGTVQWRVFNAKKKLAPFLATRQESVNEAAGGRREGEAVGRPVPRARVSVCIPVPCDRKHDSHSHRQDRRGH
jgi:RNA polymerase sigma-70 factor (ECF subfamily)